MDPVDPDPALEAPAGPVLVPVAPAGLVPVRAVCRGAPASCDAAVRADGDEHPRLRDDAGSERHANGGPFIAARIQPASDTYGTLGVAFPLELWIVVVSQVIVGLAMLNTALAHHRWPGSGGGTAHMIRPSRLLAGSAHMGVAVGRDVTRPMAGLVAAGQRIGARLALDALDALLASTTAEVATDRVLASPWTERTVSKALTGPLVGVAAREVAQGAVLERVLDEVLATEVLDHIVDRAEQAGAVHRLADRVLADGIVERGAERFLAGPEFERLVVLTVDSPAIERAIGSVFESRLVDQVVARLLASPELWRLVDEVARSPAVTEAITQQGFGLADQVAGEVRDRSRGADVVVERTTRRLLRRRPRMDPPTGPLKSPGAT